ncbi:MULTISPECIES: flagellar basal body P-ring formation chaperone FlgA [unclassified Legionella]|uniref:flagellar basal body P-ring formation chaperone FlgA n=1 Tax=unclassified Legionella TaxID=2622702 RepID=UPI001054511E|nr:MULTISPECIES: flagellar basal body P-ring formation chaperone FlgA [unclassified Legionella]MDI9819294.1 flagellar basal body P-ring formation chaperone FlgA [Legionella sp. PL877]
MKRTILVFLLLFTTHFLEAAESIQSLDLIKEQIQHHLLASIGPQQDGKLQISIENIDPRIQLKPCDEKKLDVFNPYQTLPIHTTIMGIRCQETNNHWTLYVPVKIILQKTVLIAKRPLAKGIQLVSTDIDTQEVDVSQLKQGYFSKTEDVIGQICKTAINQGNVITPNNLQTAALIHKGEQVTIQALSDTINVSMKGIALSDGVIGEMIKVKNLTSKKIVEAQVSAPNKVRVTI